MNLETMLLSFETRIYSKKLQVFIDKIKNTQSLVNRK